MRDDFDNIRAERETPYRTAATQANQHAGLSKQIAIGIVAGHLSLGLIGAMVCDGCSAGWLLGICRSLRRGRRGRGRLLLLSTATHNLQPQLPCQTRR